MRRFVFAAALAAGLAAAPAIVQAQASSPPPLIPRSELFGNPTRAGGQISPDGRWLSWIAPSDGVLNVWVAPIDRPDAARVLTRETVRPIRSYFWAADSSRLLYVNDTGGNENFLLYGVAVEGGEPVLLTPYENTRVFIAGVSRDHPGRVLVGLNNRDPRWHDLHSVDLATGEVTPVMMNDGGYAGFVADEQLVPRVAARTLDNGDVEYFRIEAGQVAPEPFATVGFADSTGTSPIGFTRDGSTLYWLDSRGRDKAALVAQDWATGELSVVAEDARADVGGVLLDPDSGEVDAYAVNYLRNEWTAVDPEVGADLEFLRSQLPGQIGVSSRDDADALWIVGHDPVTAPSAAYLYNRQTRDLTRLYVTRPELEDDTLSAMHPVEITARDGRTLVSYLTLPPGSDADGDGRPEAAVPMVLFVHGGPWARDSYGYNSWHQWLSNRGYAVLSVNYRGSTGFGKDFVNASHGEWAGAMHDDLIDAVEWAVESDVADPDRVAIAGGSYGGYATLVGLTFTPETFACGVDIVGPSNLHTLYSTFPPYWTSGLSLWRRALGDPETPEGLALMMDRSPISRVDQIRRPLLIGQGANDPRVRQSESDQIVAAMAERGIPVTYVLFPDEGHGFARPVNNIAFNAVAENFLSECLGGRAEAIGSALEGSTLVVPHGAEHAPGLADALAARTPSE